MSGMRSIGERTGLERGDEPLPVVASARGGSARSELAVYVFAHDPVLCEGLAAWLLRESGIKLLDQPHTGELVVVAAVLDSFDESAFRDLQRLRGAFGARLLLVVPEISERLLLQATQVGVGGVLRRSDVTPATLVGALRAVAAGEGSLPADAVGRLLGAMERLHHQVLSPNGLTAHGLTERELEVLRLAADGLDTAEIARELSYSERTIKDILHQVTTRLRLRNRTHAVAYAFRTGAL